MRDVRRWRCRAMNDDYCMLLLSYTFTAVSELDNDACGVQKRAGCICLKIGGDAEGEGAVLIKREVRNKAGVLGEG